MRYIQKLDTPKSFIKKTKDLKVWKEYHQYCNRQKRALRKYILKYEQNFLCIYCESKISSTKESSHIEHIKPKSLDIENLTFDYLNISVSCNGNCENTTEDKRNYNCGHRKDKKDTPYNNNKFLNPIIKKDIREYFKYDFDDGLINPSNKDKEKAQYMIDTLHLNDGGLPKARKKALQIFIQKINKISDKKIRSEKINNIFEKENIAFISFLKFRFDRS